MMKLRIGLVLTLATLIGAPAEFGGSAGQASASERIVAMPTEVLGVLRGRQGFVVPGHTGWTVQVGRRSVEVDISRVERAAARLINRRVRASGVIERRGTPDGEVIYVLVVSRLRAA